MVAQTTRLEYSIVAVALLVLLFCSKPPNPGTAGVTQPEEPVSVSVPVEPTDEIPVEANEAEPAPAEEDRGLTSSDFEPIDEPPNGTEGQETVPTEPMFDEPAPAPLPVPKITGNAGSGRITSSSRPTTRLVTLKPGNTEPPESASTPTPGETRKGEISVRYVWNGNELVMQKVRIVRESDGTTKVYSLDNDNRN